MFKCSAMASNCGGCRRTDPVYQCGWDAANNRCCAFDECAGPSWLSPDDICTNPALFSVRHALHDFVHEINCDMQTCVHNFYGFLVRYVQYTLSSIIVTILRVHLNYIWTWNICCPLCSSLSVVTDLHLSNVFKYLADTLNCKKSSICVLLKHPNT